MSGSRRQSPAAQAREETIAGLRANIPGDAARGAEAITEAVGRLDVVDLMRAGLAIATIADLADGDTDDSEPTGTG